MYIDAASEEYDPTCKMLFLSRSIVDYLETQYPLGNTP